METIISSVVTGVVAIVVCVINSHHQASTTRALIEYKLEVIEKKQDKHNHVVERVYRLEEEQAVMKEKISVANHRIDDLENAH